ncbi:hypothetical protein [Amycolatopsis anabasis]|uniref:hypothetical protein n=1 Tax=Amycolatopsis anabasis TaxID=1840409 RepID=UPI00131BE6CA|nr:hypothetical protein [Amycolatopsis anabasis]
MAEVDTPVPERNRRTQAAVEADLGALTTFTERFTYLLDREKVTIPTLHSWLTQRLEDCPTTKTLYNIRSGHTRHPDDAFVQEIASLFRVRFEDLAPERLVSPRTAISPRTADEQRTVEQDLLALPTFTERFNYLLTREVVGIPELHRWLTKRLGERCPTPQALYQLKNGYRRQPKDLAVVNGTAEFFRLGDARWLDPSVPASELTRDDPHEAVELDPLDREIKHYMDKVGLLGVNARQIKDAMKTASTEWKRQYLGLLQALDHDRTNPAEPATGTADPSSPAWRAPQFRGPDATRRSHRRG